MTASLNIPWSIYFIKLKIMPPSQINGRLLRSINYLSKIGAAGSAFVLLPLLVYALAEEPSVDARPIEKSFHGASFRVSGAAKAPATIIIYDGERKIFYAGCGNLTPSICVESKYYDSKWPASRVDVAETSPGRGYIIKISGEANVSSTSSMEELRNLQSQERDTRWRSVYGLFIVTLVSLITLGVSGRILAKRSAQTNG